MKNSHIFIMVSYMETFGLVYLEAMALGSIVIASTNEGIDGIIKNNHNGILSPAGNETALTQTLEKLILQTPASEQEALLTHAHQTIKQYTEKQAAHQYLEHLTEHLKKRQDRQNNK